MSKLTSNLAHLPALEQMRDEETIKIVRVVVTDYPSEKQEMVINIVNGTSSRRAVVNLYKVDDPRVAGYLPSKAWIMKATDGQLVIRMSYYTCAAMPDRARPLGEGPCYVFALYVKDHEVVEYPVEWKTFIDHIECDNGIWYLFVFGEKEYDKIVVSKGDQ